MCVCVNIIYSLIYSLIHILSLPWSDAIYALVYHLHSSDAASQTFVFVVTLCAMATASATVITLYTKETQTSFPLSNIPFLFILLISDYLYQQITYIKQITNIKYIVGKYNSYTWSAKSSEVLHHKEKSDSMHINDTRDRMKNSDIHWYSPRTMDGGEGGIQQQKSNKGNDEDHNRGNR